ncbi:hypothetical protein [Xanthomonas sp. XNM01]|uniref:hypothetical protein n=1 Tax=Xanthomonas sp. XNM01 TaxID=2769289 RepID=UPI0017856D5A|nr:hypothetical protein [Xanthomonas sp. XNM01]MBD9368539.1 hypothetical protein [Xanthomonas sp. XNM01]
MRHLLVVVALLVSFPASAGWLADRAIMRELKRAVATAEQEAVDDSATRTDCTSRPKIWRAPIRSLTQEIQVKRCDVVYYYTAGYAAAVGDLLPVGFVVDTTFDGTENLTTGEFTGSIVASPERAR